MTNSRKKPEHTSEAPQALAPVAPVVSSDDEESIDAYAARADLPSYAAPMQPSYSFPLVRYSKGVLVVSSAKPYKYTGWHIGVEQSAELDNLLEQAGVPMVRVKHQPHKAGNEESYWQLDSLKGYILCQGVPDSYGPNEWKRTGVPYVWNEHMNTYTYGSQLQSLFFWRGLLELGYNQPLVLALSRTVTEHFVHKVFHRHAAMIEVIKKSLTRQGKPSALAFYAYLMELIKGTDEVATKGGGSYFPPATTIPGPLTHSFVREHETPKPHLEVIESFLPLLMPWAEAANARLQEPPRDTTGNATSGEPEQPPEE